jgi:hypothetical protein
MAERDCSAGAVMPTGLQPDASPHIECRTENPAMARSAPQGPSHGSQLYEHLGVSFFCQHVRRHVAALTMQQQIYTRIANREPADMKEFERCGQSWVA